MSEKAPISPFAPPDPTTRQEFYPVQTERTPVNVTSLKRGQSTTFFRNDCLLDVEETSNVLGVLDSTTLADIEIAESSFAPPSRLSLIGYSVPKDRQTENFKGHRTYLYKKAGANESSVFVDITDRSLSGLGQDEVNSLGFTKKVAETVEIMSLFNGGTIMIANKGEAYLKVTSRTNKSGSSEAKPGVESIWDYTVNAKELLNNVNIGRPQITRDSRIDGGAFVTSNGSSFLGEIIVVDDKYDGHEMDRLMKEAKRMASQKSGDMEFNTILSVYNLISKEFPYASVEAVDEYLKTINMNDSGEFTSGTKIPLVDFMKSKAVICRHQSLITGRILEKLIDDHSLAGRVSIDRSRTWDPLQEKSEGHAWVRYVDKRGEVWVLDIAQGYFGRLSDSKSLAQWNYYREEDRQAEDARKRIQQTK